MEKGIKRSANDPTSSEPGPKRFKYIPTLAECHQTEAAF